MAELKPAYLVCGDDDAKIDAWRARVRRRAEEERGPGGLEIFDARSSEPAEIVAALSALTFDPGTRYVLVDDVGAWKAAELGPLESILAEMPPETVLVAIARGKALKQLCEGDRAGRRRGARVRRAEAVGAAQVDRSSAVASSASRSIRRPPRSWWPGRHQPAAALARAGEARARRSTRARTSRPRTSSVLAAGDTAPQAYDLADALVAGDLKATLALAEQLESHGERPGRLVYPVVRRLREVHRAASLLDQGHA